MSTKLSTLRLILWPTVLTGAVSALRLFFELQGSVTNASGGRLAPLGIVWLVFVFGAWFGWRLRRTGSGPRAGRAWLWALLAFGVLAGTTAFNLGGLDRVDTGEVAFQQLRGAVRNVALVAVPLAVVMFVVWTRLAWTLLLYAIPARLTVLLITWVAKTRGWDTHYTKLGPAGIEREMPVTMFGASLAQLGIWVPFTVVAGCLAGTVVAALAGRRRAS